jgi:carnitine 3-dehydrogenase
MAIIADVSRIAIIGAGTIGASWSALCLARGLDVTAYDPAPGREHWLRQFIDRAWPTLETLGLAEGASRDRLRFEADLGRACVGVQFLQENAPENEAMKIDLLSQVEQVLAADVTIASSSSALLISRLQKGAKHPERIVLGHPFNPPHIVPLVEVVGGSLTSPATIQKAFDFYMGLGKTPVVLTKEINGHIANRIQAAVFREAVHLLAEGVATLGDIDAAVSNGPGLRWALIGPFLTYHLAGGQGGMEAFFNHFAEMQQVLWRDLGAPALTDALQKRIIDDMASQVAGRTVDVLTADRDARLIAVLASRDSKHQ